VRVIIFANGDMADPVREAAAWVGPGDQVVAANGGSRHALAAGVIPHLVVGDLDSLSGEDRQCMRDAGTRFITSVPDKDETDLELALVWAAQQTGVEEIVVLGAFGGRPDQALANLLLLAHSALIGEAGLMPPGQQVLMVDRQWVVTLLCGGQQLDLSGSCGDRVSLIPLGGAAVGVTTDGLAFPLQDEALAFGPARGVSNRLEGEVATITLREGLLWCFHERTACTAQGELKEGREVTR
jgi:thiamine pyrophosphokinase